MAFKEVKHPIKKWSRRFMVSDDIPDKQLLKHIEWQLKREKEELIRDMVHKGRAYVEDTIQQEFNVRDNCYMTWARFVYVGRKRVHEIPTIKNPHNRRRT